MDRRRKLILVAVILMAVSIVAAQSPNAKDGPSPFSISISLPAATMKIGSPVKVDLVFTNTSSVPITLEGKFVIPYNIQVRDANGVMVALTAEGKDWKRRFDGIELIPPAGATFDINPGDSLKEMFVVSDLYDLSKPGVYKIQFHRELPGVGVAHSNIVSVTVTP